MHPDVARGVGDLLGFGFRSRRVLEWARDWFDTNKDETFLPEWEQWLEQCVRPLLEGKPEGPLPPIRTLDDRTDYSTLEELGRKYAHKPKGRGARAAAKGSATARQEEKPSPYGAQTPATVRGGTD